MSDAPEFSFNLNGTHLTPGDLALGHLAMAAHTVAIATLHANVQIAERMVGLASQGIQSNTSPFNTGNGDIALHDLGVAAIAYAEALGYVKVG